MTHAPNSVPLRRPAERMAFCDAYFSAVGARLVYDAEEYREYELPRDVDKELTDRPYYWMWVEQTGQQVPPTVLRLAFSEAAMERENRRLKDKALADFEQKQPTDIERMFFRPPTAELVTLGSFRLDKIFASVEQRGRFACVEVRDLRGRSPLVPWLMINALVSYRCDSVEQEWLSIGVCLVTGQVVERFMALMGRLEWMPANPQRLLSTARLPLHEAVAIARRHLSDHVEQRPRDWALDAQARLQAELRQIRTYYGSLMPDVQEDERALLRAEQARKEQELAAALTPRIEIELIQAALMGLTVE